ncbi:hypothetical protein, partial [Paenibacillus chitinolyticus]|uniref:hypothetical protein n=1 Tax=Paenibacillus chitinolyticus TaxID=79263 RepID=UPI00363637E5
AAKAKQADADGVSTPACSLGFFHLSVKRGLDHFLRQRFFYARNCCICACPAEFSAAFFRLGMSNAHGSA